MRIAVLAFALFSTAAVFAARPLVVGISESFPAGEKSSKVMVNASYADAVARGGHVPVVIPRFGTEEQFDVLVSKLDVLILTGGEDVDPARYKAPKSPKLGTVNASRDGFDFRLLAAARRRNLPVMDLPWLSADEHRIRRNPVAGSSERVSRKGCAAPQCAPQNLD